MLIIIIMKVGIVSYLDSFTIQIGNKINGEICVHKQNRYLVSAK